MRKSHSIYSLGLGFLLSASGVVKAEETATPVKVEAKAKEKAPAKGLSDLKPLKKVEPKWITTKSGLKYFDEVVGTGKVADRSSMPQVKVHYTGTLTNGTKFDSSRDRGDPFSFGLGAGQVIAGWEEGVDGMKAGGKRKLEIPPNLGYGSRPAGSIPPNSTLLFDIELLDVK